MKRIALLMLTIAIPLLCVHAETIDLDAARKAALEKSASVREAALAAESAGLSTTIARADLFPSVSAGSSISTSLDNPSGNLTTPSLSLSASGTIFAGGSRILALRTAGKTEEKAAEALRSGRLSAIDNLDTLYLSALKTAKNAEAAAKDLEAAAKALELATAKRSAGSLSEVDFLEAQSTWASKKTTSTAASWAALTARRKLASAIGRDVEPAPIADDRWAELTARIREKAGTDPDSFVAALYAGAATRNPDLKAAGLAVDIAKIAEASSASDFLPTVSASIETAVGGDSSATTLERTSISVSASIPILPVSGRLASLRKARLATDSSRAALASSGDELKLSLYTALVDFLSAVDQIDTANMAQAYAERNELLVQEKLKLSSATLSDLVDAEATLSTARYQFISANFAEYTALLTLRQLAGFESEGELLDAIR